MLAAINPKNTSLAVGYPVCHSQGELFYLIDKNNTKEVFIDKDLPGNLSLDALIKTIKAKYPDIEVSVICAEEAEQELKANRVEPDRIFKTALLAVLIQTLFNIVIQYSTSTPRSLIYTIVAGIATIVFVYGGLQCLKISGR